MRHILLAAAATLAFTLPAKAEDVTVAVTPSSNIPPSMPPATA